MIDRDREASMVSAIFRLFGWEWGKKERVPSHTAIRREIESREAYFREAMKDADPEYRPVYSNSGRIVLMRGDGDSILLCVVVAELD